MTMDRAAGAAELGSDGVGQGARLGHVGAAAVIDAQRGHSS